MYKASAFNVIYTDDEKALLFNSISKKYCKTIRYRSIISDIFENPDDFMDEPIFTSLKNAGMIVEDSLDELNSLVYLRNEYIYNSQLHVCILPTEQCNLRCVYCYEDFQKGEMTQNTQDAFILWLKRNIKKYTSVHIDWFGGEPLVAKDVIISLSEKIIDICHQARKPFAASITTNGTLMDLETFKKLLKCHITAYQVTIDGVKETHDNLRVRADGKGTYDTIMSNLVDIKNNIKSFSSFVITIRTNVTKEVTQQMPSHLKLLEEMFGNDNRFSFYFRPVGHWAEHKEFSFENALLKEFESLYQPIINTEVSLNYEAYRGLLEDQICSAAKRNQFILRSDGTISKCTMLLNKEENHIGKLCDDGTLKMDEQKFRRWILADTQLPSACQQCNLGPACFGMSCPAKSFVLDSPKKCGYEKESLPFILKLLDQNELFSWIEEDGGLYDGHH